LPGFDDFCAVKEEEGGANPPNPLETANDFGADGGFGCF
jgi:hypothetical protein